MQSSTHESFDREAAHEGSSDRSFGLVFTAFFALVSVWPMLHKRPFRAWALWVSGAFLVTTLVRPGVLGPLNRLWTQLGKLLSKVTNPVITGLMFFLIFAPAGVILRLLGKDLMRLKYDPIAESYWIRRDPAGLVPESMRNQF